MHRRITPAALAAALCLALALPARTADAHCDTLDGPVVDAGREALDTGKLELALIWVQPADEAELRNAFAKVRRVRNLDADARELADTYFLETLVRLHRAGEGAPYTGLKPAGTDLGVAIPAADRALRTGKLRPVTKLLTRAVAQGLEHRFHELRARRSYRADDVDAGRAYVAAYVAFVHYVEGTYAAATHGADHDVH